MITIVIPTIQKCNENLYKEIKSQLCRLIAENLEIKYDKNFEHCDLQFYFYDDGIYKKINQNIYINLKIIGTFLVIIESLFCTILKIINIFLAYLLYYTFDVIPLLFYALAFYFGYQTYQSYMFGSSYLVILECFFTILMILMPYLLNKLFNILINKNPTLINNLNMYLFKKAIGYK